MSNALENFLANAEGSKEEVVEDKKILSPIEPIESGTMLITGCVDFAKPIGSKDNVYGLEVPHRVDFPYPVLKCFSGSSAMHSFTLLTNGDLYAMGKNSNNQLGDGTNITQYFPGNEHLFIFIFKIKNLNLKYIYLIIL